MRGQPNFSGSYKADDVTFLLTPIGPQAAARLYVEPAAKEPLIQQGLRHYSEMISPESAPSAAYMAIFETALSRHGARMAREVAQLIRTIDARIDGPITLCSLVRAGVPLGVLLQRGLTSLGRDCVHFGISIIRDRGIDAVAMAHVLGQRPPQGVLFVDGWTGKGAIAAELEQTLSHWPELQPRMVVLADPAGRAWLAAGHHDWLIPSGILGSTVSGLISRSILNDQLVLPGEFHAALDLQNLASHDVSRRFVDLISANMQLELAGGAPLLPDAPIDIRQTACAVIDAIAKQHGIANRNRIKPGIAEATRAVLRRAPERILVAAGDDPDLDGLRHLAHERSVTVETPKTPLFPYRAVTIIADAASP
jgi:hypothetical protein